MAGFTGDTAGTGSTARLLDSVSALAAATFTFGSGASGFGELVLEFVDGSDAAAEGAAFSFVGEEMAAWEDVAGSAEQQNNTRVERIKEPTSVLQARGGDRVAATT